jgi:transmembrane sensor
MKKGKSNKLVKDLLVKSLVGRLTDADYNSLINDSEVKAMMFRQWEENTDIKIKVKQPEYKKILHDITRNVKEETGNGRLIEFQEYKNRYRSLRKSYILFRTIAACIFIALFITAAIYISNTSGKATWSEIIAPRGQKSKVILEDGTIAWLNSGTTIKYSSSYNKKNREVELIGEAYFDVADNTRLPFVVNASGLKVSALGTHFDLMAYPEDETFSVTLVEGKVQINTPDNKKIDLLPNQKAIYNKSDYNLIVEKVDPVFSISWKDNVLKFDNEPLPDILAHLERWYDVKFYYPEDVLNYQRFTLTIKTESLREVLELIRISTPIKFKIDVDSVYITLIN